MQFHYKATTREGKTVSGTAEAVNRQALLATLHKQGLRPILVGEGAKKKSSSGLFKPKEKVKLQELMVFTRQLSVMISAGVPLARSLSALQGDAANPYMKQVLAGITKDVESGLPLGDAFAKYPKVFSDVYVNMVRAGEEGGILDEILKRLATQVELDSSMRKKIKSASTYPIVLLVVTIVAFFGMMLFIIPKLGGILTSLGGPKAKLPVYTQVLLNFSKFFTGDSIIAHLPLLGPLLQHTIGKLPLLGALLMSNAAILLIVFAVVAVYLLRYIRTPKGKYKFHYFLLHVPILKTVILKIAVARFSRTFASLMSAGVSVLDALEVTGGAIGNKVIEQELVNASQEIKNGKQLSEPISNSKYFPPIVSQMLLVGEETGQIDTVLVKIADFYEEEVSVLIDGLASIIEPVMIVFLGAAVGLIAASVMGPIANLSKNIGG